MESAIDKKKLFIEQSIETLSYGVNESVLAQVFVLLGRRRQIALQRFHSEIEREAANEYIGKLNDDIKSLLLIF